MCPEKVLLSAYYDKELEGKFKAAVESHVHSCDACRKSIDEFAEIEGILHQEDTNFLLRNKEYIKTRVFEYSAVRERRRFWKKGIMLPVPLVFTALALVCFLIGGVTFLSVNRSNNAIVSGQGNSGAIEIQSEELALLKKLLESEGVVVEVNMQLPEQDEIKIIGEPQILTQEQKINLQN